MAQLTLQQALDLAMEHHRAGRLAEAEEIYRQLREVVPDNSDIVQLLGLAAYQARRYPEGRELIGRAIAMNPNVPHYHNNLGTLLLDIGELDQALSAFQRAIQLAPTNAPAWYNCGLVHTKKRQWPEAMEACRKALQLNPDNPPCILNLGNALSASGQLDAAIDLYRTELPRHPREYAIWTNLGNVLKEKGDTDAAIEAYRAALALEGREAVTLNNLGIALKEQGQLDESIAAFRRSLEAAPDNAEMRSNLILTLFYSPDTGPSLIEEEQRLWNRHLLDPLRSSRAVLTNDPSPERRLRIGYVSADFRDHVVGRALLPIFERHDLASYEVYCYANSQRDAVTDRFIARASVWREMEQLSDEQLAGQIQADGIDILVDLALHTSDNRLCVFARKPAPVQVSWLGYPGSSGLETIDYRLTDAFLEPPGSDAGSAAEQPFRLPDCWTCYEPPDGSPPVNDLPALRNGIVTFGSFNSFSKINDRVLDTWMRILAGVAGSRLKLLTKSGAHRKRLADFLHARGIDPSRLELADYEPTVAGRPTAGYLRRYHGIDIALDTYPYNGMTTTCDSLWMGVPVVSLVGKLSLGRAGLSLLSNIAFPELAVHSEEGYVQQVMALAHDLPRLAGLRATLRSRLQSSPIVDAAQFTRHIEAAYRTMWRAWCAKQSAALPS